MGLGLWAWACGPGLVGLGLGAWAFGPRPRLVGYFAMLLISSFYVAGVGETRTRHKKGLVLSQVVRFAIWDWSLVDWVLLARGGFWRQQAGQLIGLAMQCRVIARSIEFSAF